MNKEKCYACNKPAVYYTQTSTITTLWKIDKKGNSEEIDNWGNNIDPDTTYYCEECAEDEGIID